MAKIEAPVGLGLKFATPSRPPSPYQGADLGADGIGRAFAARGDRTLKALSQIGSIPGQLKQAADQEGLKRVAQGGAFNDDGTGGGSVFDKVSRTMQHLKGGTLGQHKGEYDKTPMDKQSQNVGYDPKSGQWYYDPRLGSQAKIDEARARREKAEADIAEQNAKRTGTTPSGNKYRPDGKGGLEIYDPKSGQWQPAPANKPTSNANAKPVKDMPSDGPLPGANVAGTSTPAGSSTLNLQTGQRPDPAAQLGTSTNIGGAYTPEPQPFNDYMSADNGPGSDPSFFDPANLNLPGSEPQSGLYASNDVGGNVNDWNTPLSGMFGPSPFTFGGDNSFESYPAASDYLSPSPDQLYTGQPDYGIDPNDIGLPPELGGDSDRIGDFSGGEGGGMYG